MFGGLGGFGGIGGGKFDPRKMQAMMKKLGMDQEEIPAERVVIERANGGKIVIENPSVARISIQGQESFQISGNVSEQQEISQEDIKAVMEKTGATQTQARKALEDADGDLAEAIMKLS